MAIRKTCNGFTLIELMITVAIVGILAAIAIPNYQDSVKKSRRSDAAGALTGLASAMERKYTENNHYCDQGGTGGSSTCGGADNDTGISALATTTNPYYDFKVDSATTSTFSISANPKGAQSGDKCGKLTLTNTGVKGLSGAQSGVNVADCW